MKVISVNVNATDNGSTDVEFDLTESDKQEIIEIGYMLAPGSSVDEALHLGLEYWLILSIIHKVEDI